ncbi:hypothetical protein ONS95_015053 [Cadophora gregata]|uniref:uncharacterized protein n=1 Tax=Cadophora gregata TaxID=51156 RepID=UPI0026DCE79C|nr:uncharacterized protein ONS95_015053 [Cadophora gregata]KAK0124397.1 hypothetical protein ONS95_015053 [Cadophora gregata]KAK0129753.1 hypothetical protein ONS96_000308 [Cadophora gregata f. sp. sojae]
MFIPEISEWSPRLSHGSQLSAYRESPHDLNATGSKIVCDLGPTLAPCLQARQTLDTPARPSFINSPICTANEFLISSTWPAWVFNLCLLASTALRNIGMPTAVAGRPSPYLC